MQILIIKPKKIYKYDFLDKNVDTYWINDVNQNNDERNLIAVKKVNDTWSFFSNDVCYLEQNGKRIKTSPLFVDAFYTLKIVEENGSIISALAYIANEKNELYTSYAVIENRKYTIGSDNNQNIILHSAYIPGSYAILVKDENGFFIESVNDNCCIYVNDNRFFGKRLEFGDTIFILGYRFIIMKDYIMVGSPNDKVTINSASIIKKEISQNNVQLLETIEDDNSNLYNENDYYSRQPRFVTSIKENTLRIDSPPAPQEPDETPIIYTLGPMLTMTMTSAVSVSTSVINLANGKANFLSVLPALVIAFAMISSTLLWPSLLRKFNKKKQAEREEKRQKKYSQYLIDKKNKINDIKLAQRQLLIENYSEPKFLHDIVINRKRNLWERQIDSEDFLDVRVGIGTIPLKLNLNYSIEDFTMSEDKLKEELVNVAETAKDVPNSPVMISLTQRNKMVLIGKTNYKEDMLKSIILQLATYHSYDDLKLVFMINDTTSNIWESFKILPHTWSDGRNIRFYANNFDDMSKLSFYLEQVFTARKYFEDENGKRIENETNFRNTQPYYLIVVDTIKKTKNIEIINTILKEENNLGFGLIILDESISNLPNEVNDFLTADGENSAIITSDLSRDNQQIFAMDNLEEINLPLICEKISNIPIKSNKVLNEIKNSLGFLEMYKVGKIDQLNIFERWKLNNPVNSLSVPIGIREDGEIFNLDLHEKFHGPHGLIAGMTGSGKSEFIITFILSMCLNYSPEEVSFVLIDYKGGGLTGAFENKLLGIKLPHLAGTITNLDTAEIKRSLASIQSELKRRQELFNKAKTKLNESTLDIYKYQQLYRDGLIDEPVSHLFIISDEFAELKSQQSSFMNELISTARIGRSLGVHLILATQKPSGIVDDQIWSNSKFKVCLKVQERSDSMDVIKCPDAVMLKNVGRFYLQVGYNDFFAIGQAAYAGVKYIPKDKVSKMVDRDISFLNNIGDTIKSIETADRKNSVEYGEELPNILKYIGDSAAFKGVVARRLWLDKIPNEIFVTNLIKKYSYVPTAWNIKAIVGERDDPNNQRQNLLTLDFNEEGNTLIYGASDKEMLLISIIYSLIISYSPAEINIYIVDFGSEMFRIFLDSPHVGDVILINQTEKLNNLFISISKELEKRKKLFADYNGNYNSYIKNSRDTLPRIMIIINNYELLNENYEEYVDIVSLLTREGEKYGIFFVISVTGVNGVRGKTSQNFSNHLCLQFNDESEYSTILGPTHGMLPTNTKGRGLVKIDGEIFEFQTAYAYKWDEINAFIKNICIQLNQKFNNKAPEIAILPKFVNLDCIKNSISTPNETPIGIIKENLAISTFNFLRNPISLISAQDVSMLDKFVPSLGQVIQKMLNVELYIIDYNESIIGRQMFKNYFGANNIDAFEQLKKKVSQNEDNKYYIFLIYGIESFVNSFDDDGQRELKNVFYCIKRIKNIRIIFADSVTKIKLYEYEDFYRDCVQPINAIWVGSGITDQFTIKSSTYNKETRSQISNDFGYNVDRGNAIQIKVLDFYSEE